MALRKPVKLKNLKQAAAKPAVGTPMHMHGENCAVCGPTCCGCHIAGLFCSKKMWLMVIVSIVLVNVFEMVWNGYVMMPDYVATANLWRPFDQMNFNLIYTANTLIAVVFAILFKLAYRGSGIVEGIKNGVLIAAPLAICSGLTTYATQPIPAHLAQFWALGALVEGALVGLALSLLSCCCKK